MYLILKRLKIIKYRIECNIFIFDYSSLKVIDININKNQIKKICIFRNFKE
jgi:hypothetical protein